MENKIISIISQVLEVDINKIKPDMAIGDLPEWNSLNHIKIIASIEKEYNIKFASTDLAEIEDISDIVSLTKEMIEA